MRKYTMNSTVETSERYVCCATTMDPIRFQLPFYSIDPWHLKYRYSKLQGSKKV